EEGKRAPGSGHARAIPADHRERDRRCVLAGGDGASEIGNDETRSAIRHAGERQRPARFEPLGRGSCEKGRAHGFALARLWKAITRRSTGGSCAAATASLPTIHA